MLATILKIKPLCTRQVNFYTIKFQDSELSEFENFLKKLSANERNEEELNEIMGNITEIGKRGAISYFFNREENNAYALPPRHFFIKSSNDFGIRLYCVVLTKRIVFLLNGDRKKTKKANDPKSGVSKFFRQANSLFDELMKDKASSIIGWNSDGPFLDYEPDYTIDIKG